MKKSSKVNTFFTRNVSSMKMFATSAKQDKHYENTPIQNILKILPPKMKLFRKKNLILFHISAKNIDCGYSLEPSRSASTRQF